MAATLACGEGAALSHMSAAALWKIRREPRSRIEVSVSGTRHPRCPELNVHRRMALTPTMTTTHRGVPVTTPTMTFVDLATRLGRDSLEAAINQADKNDLIDPDSLRDSLAALPPLPGTARLRATLDHRTFTLTDSELERRFLPIASRAGLPRPQTQVRVNGFRVDFHWPELGLVVETDGLRYHRTPAQQARDRIRDQAHAAAGTTPLRFTRAQVRYDPAHVEVTLVAVAQRLQLAAAA
jgi:very-short-patch-repair endonuclease